MRNLRQAAKVLVGRPWYTASNVTVVAVGVAIVSSVLAVVDGVLFKPLGYPGERQLVAIRVSSSQSRSEPRVTPADLDAWARAVPGAGFTGFRLFGVSDSVSGRAVVQANFFDVIGVMPALGGFAPEDFGGAAPLIEPRILTDDLFQVEFGGDASAIGRTVITNRSTGAGFRVAGVMPPGFVFPTDRVRVGFLSPFLPRSLDSVQNFVVARVPTGVSADEVKTRLQATFATRPADQANPPLEQAVVQPLRVALTATSRPLFTGILLAAVLLVMIAVLNAASLMAARSLDRESELAVRRALGASSVDLIRLVSREVSLVVGAGTLVGLALAVPLLRLIVPLLPDKLVLFRTAAVDYRIAGMVAAVAMVIVGVTSAVLGRQVIGRDARLRPDRNVTTPSRSTGGLIVVTIQVALALVLTVGGSLLVASVLSVYAQAEPIRTKGVIVIRASFDEPLERSRRMTRVKAILHRLRQLRDVDAAAAVAADFLNGGYSQPWFVAPPTTRTARLVVEGQQVTSDYFRVIQPQVVAGRLPTAVEEANNDPIVVVGEGVANHYWPNASPLGQTLEDSGRNGGTRRTFTVVGVIKDVRWFSWDKAEVPTIYSPYELTARLVAPTFLVHTSAQPSGVIAEVVRAMSETDPALRLERPALLDALFVDSIRARRFQGWLFGSFAIASLLIVGIGIFGQLAMMASRRKREVGIRMACGATRVGIVRLITVEQSVPVLIGVLAGGIASMWAVRFVGAYLYEITTSDVRVWAASIGLIILTAIVGTLVPAIRASLIDPARALVVD